jgi:hypothetical protein
MGKIAGNGRRRFALAIAAVSGGLVVLAAGLSGAAAGAVQPAGSRSAAELAGVSCPASSWCMAVGSYTTAAGAQHALAQTWNGSSWKVLKPPGTALTGVSCTATWFCLATGGPTRAERWNGTTWRQIPGPQDPVNAGIQNLAGEITCGSRTMCMVINGTAHGNSANAAETWNGHRWRTWRQDTNLCALSDMTGSPCALSGISCGTATSCVAVGTYTGSLSGFEDGAPYPGAFTWNGQRWTDATTAFQDALGMGPATNTVTTAFNVACAGPSCLAMAGSQQSDESLGATWQARTRTWSATPGFTCPNGGSRCSLVYFVGSMSCASATSCMVFATVPPEDGPARWNGTTWTFTQSIAQGPHSLLAGISCHATMCLAIGYHSANHHRRTLAELWNGATWMLVPTPDLT